MSAFQWTVVIVYPAVLTALSLYLNFRGETDLRAVLQTRENERQEAYQRSRQSIGQLQQVVEHQDLLLMALWHQVYGVQSSGDGWDDLNERFRLSPNWKIHKSHLEMVRRENYPWYQGIGETRWTPSITDKSN